jgi:hypothetical protein
MTECGHESPNSQRVFYHKMSMTPTFTPGDLLTVMPYGGRMIRPGDVVVFPSPKDGELVTHRVMKVKTEGVTTRGDFWGSKIDPWTLKLEGIVGYVVGAEREGRSRQVLGGPVGLAYHHAHRVFARGRRSLRRIVLRPARLLRLGALLRSLNMTTVVPQGTNPRVLCVRRGEGAELLLLFGRKVVGRSLPGRHGWTIRLWYLPFVRREALEAATREALRRNPSQETEQRSIG